ncbi:MAG: hypothetical protein AAGA57_02830 [Planctomycetota bacterium]
MTHAPRITAGLLIAVSALSAPAWAQPEGDTPAPPPEQREGPPPDAEAATPRQAPPDERPRERIRDRFDRADRPEGRDGRSPDRPRGDRDRDDRDRDGRDRDRDRDRERAMDPADALAVIERLQPELAKSMQPIFEQRPEAAVELIRERFPRAIELVRLRSQDPEMFEAKADHLAAATHTFELCRQLARSDADEAAMRQTLAEPMRRAAQARLVVRELELQRMAQRLDQQRAELDKLQANHDDRVESYLARAIRRIAKMRENQAKREAQHGAPADRRNPPPAEQPRPAPAPG